MEGPDPYQQKSFPIESSFGDSLEIEKKMDFPGGAPIPIS